MDIFVELVECCRFTGIELAGHAAVQDRQWLGPEFFGELEVFVKAQAERLEVVWSRPLIEFIIPAIDNGFSFRDVSHRGLPAIACCQKTPFDDAATRKAKESGMQIVEKLDEVFAQSIRPILPRVHREQGHHVEIE